MIDYYTILGVSADANVTTIKKAYRQCALESHPDLGGSHEKMLLINEAFQILTNPESRRLYDQVRSSHADSTIFEEAERESQQARNAAQFYPASWLEFDKWMDSLFNDITNARYGTWKQPDTGLKVPTAGQSVTGWIFIIAGGVVGLVVALAVLPKDSSSSSNRAGVFFVIGGATVGKMIHQALGAKIKAK